MQSELKSNLKKKPGQIKIMAEEKKPDYGKTQATFTVSALSSGI